jgi:hypothetical protein
VACSRSPAGAAGCSPQSRRKAARSRSRSQPDRRTSMPAQSFWRERSRCSLSRRPGRTATHCFWPTRRTRSTPCSTKNWTSISSATSRQLPHQKHPHCPRNPSFGVKTAPNSSAKANPGKFTIGSPFSVRPAVAKLEEQRNHQVSRCGAEQRKALEKTRRGSARDRIRSATAPQIQSTNHRHNYGLILDP